MNFNGRFGLGLAGSIKNGLSFLGGDGILNKRSKNASVCFVCFLKCHANV